MEQLSLASALAAARTALDAAATEAATSSQNIANAATPGYARERPDLAELPAFSGVAVSTIQRVVSQVARSALLAAQGAEEGAATTAGILQQAQALLGEPANGLSQLLVSFWNAWQQVATTPTDPGARDGLLAAAQQLTSRFQSITQGLQGIEVALAQSLAQGVAEVNSLAQKVAALDLQIQAGQAAGQDVNALLDQRDQLAQQLAQLAGAAPAQPPTQDYTLVIGGQPLVVGGTAYQLAVRGTGPASTVVWKDTGQPAPLTQGQLGAQAQALSQQLPALSAGLDAVARDLVAAVNGLHMTGYTLTQPPQTGIPFFAPTGTTAATIAVNPAIAQNPDLIAASGTGAPNDGSVAQSIASLATALAAGGGTQTILAEYNGVIVGLAAQLQTAQIQQQAATAQVTQFQQIDQSVSGVSLSEEQTALLLDQQMAQAATTVLAAAQSMLRSLLQAVGAGG